MHLPRLGIYIYYKSIKAKYGSWITLALSLIDMAGVWPGVAVDLAVDVARFLRDLRNPDRPGGSKGWMQS